MSSLLESADVDQFIAQIVADRLFQNGLHVSDTDRRVMAEAVATQFEQLILQIVDASDAAAAKKAFLDGVIGHFAFGDIEGQLAVLGLAVGEGHREGFDPAFVAAPTLIRRVFSRTSCGR